MSQQRVVANWKHLLSFLGITGVWRVRYKCSAYSIPTGKQETIFEEREDFFFFFLSSYMYLFPFLSVVKQFSMQNIVSSLSPLAPAQQADNFLLGKREWLFRTGY